MKIHRFETLGSTNDHLLEMAEEGAPEWTVVVADQQTGGRGRRTRNWWSPEGNLHVSILLRPEVSPMQLQRLPVIASLAFLTAMGDPGLPLKIKWPNDILLNGRKMAGILAESRSEGEKVLWAVVGFGVNMVRKEDDIPSELKGHLAFVEELDKDLEPRELAVRVTRSMKDLSGAMSGEGWNNAMEQWSQHALLNIPYLYRDAGRETRGVPVRLDASGGLVMETEDGEVTVYSGELGEPVES